MQTIMARYCYKFGHDCLLVNVGQVIKYGFLAFGNRAPHATYSEKNACLMKKFFKFIIVSLVFIGYAKIVMKITFIILVFYFKNEFY